MASPGDLTQPPMPVLPMPLPDTWVSDLERFGRNKIMVRAPEAGYPVVPDRNNPLLATEKGQKDVAKVYFFTNNDLTPDAIDNCMKTPLMLSKLTNAAQGWQRTMIGIPPVYAKNLWNSWFSNWVVFEVTHFDYIVSLRNMRLDSHRVALGLCTNQSPPPNNETREHYSQRLFDAFDAGRLAYLNALKLLHQKTWSKDDFKQSFGAARIKRIQRQWKIRVSALIETVEKLNPYPPSRAYASYNTVPRAERRYEEIKDNDLVHFWQRRLTDDLYAAFYSPVSDVVALEANLNDFHIGRLMTTTIIMVAVCLWEEVALPALTDMRNSPTHEQSYWKNNIANAGIVRDGFKTAREVSFDDDVTFPEGISGIWVPKLRLPDNAVNTPKKPRQKKPRQKKPRLDDSDHIFANIKPVEPIEATKRAHKY